MPIANVDALPSKQTGINRPGARSEQRQGCTKGAQQDVCPGISGLREDVPNVDQRYQRSSDRRPETCE